MTSGGKEKSALWTFLWIKATGGSNQNNDGTYSIMQLLIYTDWITATQTNSKEGSLFG